MVSRVEYVIEKIIILKMAKKDLWRNAYFKSFSIVTKQIFQNKFFILFEL